MTAVLGIQARASSTRLPGKVLADLAGEPLILRVVERARACAEVDSVFVLTSTEASDDPLAELLADRDVPFRRGSLSDVLSRYLELADELEPDYVVRVTGDCPLIEPGFIDAQLRALAAFDADLTVVEGGGIAGTLGGQTSLSTRALRAAGGSSDPRDREHAGSFFFLENRARFRCVALDVDEALRRDDVRLQVDEPADLERMRRIFAELGGAADVRTVLRWLDANPEVRDLNRTVGESADNRAHRRMSGAAELKPVGRWP